MATDTGFDEELYLSRYADIREAVKAGAFSSGYAHYIAHGKAEGREASTKRPRSEEAQRVADYWATDHNIDRPRSWLDHPVIQRLVRERVTGDQSINGVQWFQQSFLKGPVDAALSLGCGLGGFERDAIRMNIAKKFLATDISPGARRNRDRSARGRSRGYGQSHFL